MYLGVKAIFAKSFARIHRSNLINFGILPVVIDDEAYMELAYGVKVSIKNIHAALAKKSPLEVYSVRSNKKWTITLDLSEREGEILKQGGLLNYISKKVRR